LVSVVFFGADDSARDRPVAVSKSLERAARNKAGGQRRLGGLEVVVVVGSARGLSAGWETREIPTSGGVMGLVLQFQSLSALFHVSCWGRVSSCAHSSGFTQ